MVLFKKIFLYSMLIILTAGYCWFIELAMGAFNIFLENQQVTCWSSLTEVLAIHHLPWQILACASLLLNAYFAFTGSKDSMSFEKHIAGALYHVCWIVMCCFLHGIGVMIYFVIKVYVLK